MVTNEMNVYAQFSKDNNINLTKINSKVKQKELQAINSFYSNLKVNIQDIHYQQQAKKFKLFYSL